MPDYSTFTVGTKVRVNSAHDATIYEITQLLPDGHGCYIREEGTVNGKLYREQRFDLSMLKLAIDHSNAVGYRSPESPE